MKRERQVSMLVVFVVAAGIATGCAKRPAVATVAAPAPTGSATGPVVAAPAAPVAPPAPAPPAPAPPAPVPAPAPPPVIARPETPPPALQPPQKPAEFTPEPELRAIHFDFDRASVRPQDARILDANAAWLKANRRHAVLIEGHCDERGTNEYNLALGERRAAAARDYLVAQGIDASRITLVSYGEERPECRERTATCWARNRQARFLTKQQ